MKKLLIIGFLYLLQICHIQAQTQDCVKLELYYKFIREGKKLVQEGDYVQAMQYYNSAKDLCKAKSKEIDALFTEMIAKINKERTDMQEALVQVKTALARAEEMQRNMETAVFDKAVKERNKEWKGYNNYNNITVYHRSQILDKIDSLDLSNNALLRIPQEIKYCKNLKHLNLLGNKEIDWNSITDIKTPSIHVTINNLNQIDSTYWKQITGIENYDQNYITAIPDNILQQAQLTYLDLGGNKITEIPAKISQLKNLQYLGLIGNRLTTLPKEIKELKNLQELNLSYNDFSTLPIEISTLKNLKTLNLRDNHLTTLPKEIGQLKNLQNLCLGADGNSTNTNNGNQLITLPKEIGQLKNLQTLVLGWNGLTTLPEEIGQLKKLEKLDLNSNRLITLPKGISKLKNLQKLDLNNYDGYGNEITILPKGIGKLKNLQDMGLYFNQLTTLPKEIGQLKNLQKLNLGRNRLTTLPKEIRQLKNLQKLDLDYNQLVTLPKEIVELKNLESLSLSNNKLTTLPEEIWDLKELNLGVSLEGNMYKNILSATTKELKELDLIGQEIIILPLIVKKFTKIIFDKYQFAQTNIRIRKLANIGI